MKKISVMSLFVMAALVSQAIAEHCKEGGQLAFCQWSTGCFTINNDYAPNIGAQCSALITACKSGGELYTGATVPSELQQGPGYGEGVNCASTGLTKAAGGNEKCGFYCKWDTGCLEIVTDINGDYGDIVTNCTDAIANCDRDGERYSNNTCTGTPVTGPGGPFCYWPPSADNGNTCYCGKVDGGPATAANCEADFGEIVQSCTGYCSTPIIKFTPASKAFIVAPYGRSLHISSPKEATISLYDMNGAKVYSGKVRAGNTVFSLEKVGSGSYYAVVQSGSDAKKVPVILK